MPPALQTVACALTVAAIRTGGGMSEYLRTQFVLSVCWMPGLCQAGGSAQTTQPTLSSHAPGQLYLALWVAQSGSNISANSPTAFWSVCDDVIWSSLRAVNLSSPDLKRRVHLLKNLEFSSEKACASCHPKRTENSIDKLGATESINE